MGEVQNTRVKEEERVGRVFIGMLEEAQRDVVLLKLCMSAEVEDISAFDTFIVGLVHNHNPNLLLTIKYTLINIYYTAY